MKKKIGLVVAIEISALLKMYGKPSKTVIKKGFTTRIFIGSTYNLYVLESGAGEIAAATSTQFLICEFGVDIVLNFGVVGGLTDEMKTTRLCFVEKIIHYDFETTGWLNLQTGQYPNSPSQFIYTNKQLLDFAMERNPEIKKVTCASADKFIDDHTIKMELHNKYQADICEMEAAGIALTCNRNNVPYLIVKCVSDSLTGGGKEFLQELEKTSLICLQLVDKIINSKDFKNLTLTF